MGEGVRKRERDRRDASSARPLGSAGETAPASAAGSVDLWLWDLATAPAELARFARVLGPEEAARAKRFRFPTDRDRYIAAHGRMREILGDYLDDAPARLAFGTGSHGKPFLDGPHRGSDLRFNLSHSDHLAALGVCRGFDIGVDVEFIRPVTEDIARHFFSAAEIAALSTLSGARWERGFFRCWTRKEAIIKTFGQGLSMPLDSFDVSVAEGEPPSLLRLADDADAPNLWQIHHFEPRADCMGAVAARARGWTVVFRE